MRSEKETKKTPEKKNMAGMIFGGFTFVAIIVLAVMWAMLYNFSHDAKNLAKKASEIYGFGTGQEMKQLIAPGYINSYESTSKVLGISDIQQIYIDKFRSYEAEKVGTISELKYNITDIKAVNNIKDLQQDYANQGIERVTEYRSVDMDWEITGDKGSDTMHVQVFVLKCKDGWYVDYILLPPEVTESES